MGIWAVCGARVSAPRTALATPGAWAFSGRVWAAGRGQRACRGLRARLALAHLQQASEGDHLCFAEPGGGAGLGWRGTHRGGHDGRWEQQPPSAHCLRTREGKAVPPGLAEEGGESGRGALFLPAEGAWTGRGERAAHRAAEGPRERHHHSSSPGALRRRARWLGGLGPPSQPSPHQLPD